MSPRVMTVTISSLFKNNEKLNKLSSTVLQPKGPLFFGSVESLMKAYSSAPKHELLIIDMHEVTMVDLSGAYAMEDLIKNLRKEKVKVFISNASSQIKEKLDRMKFFDNIGNDSYKDLKSMT